ncbi:MAG TPA: ester cyclase [Gaiellaceae bacterium]|nr:ester cyclase [Gaiellaceae bacterium]
MAAAAQVVQDWAARLDAGDLDGSSAYVAEDVEWSNPVATVHGRDELRGLLGVFWTAIPDFQHDVTDAIESGDLVALRGVASGTHTGPLAGPAGEIPASGKDVTFPFAAWARVEDGLIREFRGYWDVMGFMQQIGAIPEPAAAATA